MSTRTVTEDGDEFRPRVHMREGDEVGFEERGDRVIENAIANSKLRKYEHENSPFLGPILQTRRNRAAQSAFRERTEKRLKQLKADLENQETQASASHAETEVLRKQIEALPEKVSQDLRKDGIEDSQETQLPDAVSVGDPALTAFTARSSTPQLRSKPRSGLFSSLSSRLSHYFDEPLMEGPFQELSYLGPVIAPATKALEVLPPSVIPRASALLVEPGVWYVHGSGVQQNENQFQEHQTPIKPTKNVVGSGRSADVCDQPHTRWTKISKSLVDARALDMGNEKYEEKTDEVVVFRVLPKDDIKLYISKTREIRERDAVVLKGAPSSRSSDKDFQDLIPVSNKAGLTSANDEEETAGHLKSSKQDDRNQPEAKISTTNATSVSENQGNRAQSVTELPRGYQERSHATKTRIANSDPGAREDIINSSIQIFTVFTIIFLPLSFIFSIFYFDGYGQKNEKNVIRVLLSKGFPQLYKTACKTIVSGALVAFVLYISGSYRKYLAWPLYQTLKFFPLHGRPETSSHTLEELHYTFSAPLWKHAFFKVAKKKWLSRDTSQKLRSLFRSGEERLWFSEGESARLKRVSTMNIENIPSPTNKEHPETPKKKRLYGKCRCGYRFYDDFVELRPMAVAEYGESLVRRYPTSGGRTNPVDQVVHSKGGDDIGPTRSQGSNWSSFISNSMAGIMTIVKDLANKKGSAPPLPQYELEDGGAARPGSSSCNNELLYLLMCIPQHQYATKLLQPHISAIRSDQDFFLLLRNNYRQMRGRIRRLLSLKALRSIKFVQLEMYKSELVDIRKQDDLPPEDKKDEYRYNPVPAEIIPPVGENHMLHLINHPTHAGEDGLVLDRIPKKLKERLLVSPSRGTGIGWGIYFIEGWHVSVVTIVAFAVLLAGSLAFLICWSVLKHDLQGASGVAAYIIAFLGLAIGSIQAIFELT